MRPRFFSCALPAVGLGIALSGASIPAFAEEFQVGGKPLSVDITNTAIFNYRFNNRNDQPTEIRPDPLNPKVEYVVLADPKFTVDDDYFEYLDKLNIQASYWRLRLNARIDVSAYALSLSTGTTTQYVLERYKEVDRTPTSDDIYRETNSVRRELNTRFRNLIYPAKLSLVYQQPDLEVTAGDFYVQLGRGLVLSVRKIDELAVDTTIRGGKVQLSHSFGSFRLAGTAIGGLFNPIRVDEQSGRVLQGASSPLFFGFPEANSFTEIGLVDPSGNPIQRTQPARPSYLNDAVLGGRIEAGLPYLQLSANFASVLRAANDLDLLRCRQQGGDDTLCDAQFPVVRATENPAFTHNQIRAWSGSVSLPAIGKYADIYAEVAGQQVVDGRALGVDASGNATDRVPDGDGYAIYVNANGRLGPASLSLEGKHYRRFVPLFGNIDTATQGFNAPEFAIVAYNQVPTAEHIYVQPIGLPYMCSTGGRARVDYAFDRQTVVFGWVGHYVSFSELDPGNTTCDESPDKRTNAWDVAVGGDLFLDAGKSHVKAWVGGRNTAMEVPVALGSYTEPLSTFYRETYIRYDITKHIAGPFTAQAQGFHWHRFQPETYQTDWWEGENYVALQYAGKLSAIFGYEYSNREGCNSRVEQGFDEHGNPLPKPTCHYVSGGIQWRAPSTEGALNKLLNSARIFVGQQRSALRCLSGVCRTFPAFEGAKLEIVSRF